MTTMPLTKGVKSRRSPSMAKPSPISTDAAARQAPKMAARPYSRPIAPRAPTKAIEVPMTIGMRPPTGPMG